MCFMLCYALAEMSTYELSKPSLDPPHFRHMIVKKFNIFMHGCYEYI